MTKEFFKKFLSFSIILALLIVYCPIVFAENSNTNSYNLDSNDTTISGNVWEDLNLTPNEYGVLKGDGIYQEGSDAPVSGITVKLYEIGQNEDINVDNIYEVGTYVTSTKTNSDGSYIFNNLNGGMYRVEFCYGDESSNLKYNGQDYKSVDSDLKPTIDVRNSPIDIAILIDLSNSMANANFGSIEPLKASLKKLVASLMTNNVTDDVQISLLSFSINPQTECDLTNDISALNTAIDNLQPKSMTNTAAGIKYAERYLNSHARQNAIKMFFIYTDGLPEPPVWGNIITEGNMTKIDGTTVVDEGFGNDTIEPTYNNAYLLLLYGSYYNNAGEYFDTFNYISDEHFRDGSWYYGDEVPIKVVEPIIGGSVNIDEMTDIITDIGSATADLRVQTKRLWNNVSSNIFKFSISYGRYIEAFKNLFGESKNDFIIDSNGEYESSIDDIISRYVSKDLPTSMLENLNNTDDNLSYACDSESRRLDVMNYSKFIDNKLGSILNNPEQNLGEYSKNVSMVATTPCFTAFKGQNCININFALEKRPEATIQQLSKTVNHINIKLSDGSTLIDWNKNTLQNVPHLQVIPNQNQPTLFQAIMDNELTHGASIQIEYYIDLINKSENDNLANYFSEEFLQRVLSENNPKYADWISMIQKSFNTTNVSSVLYSIIPTQYNLYDYISNNIYFDEINSPNYWQNSIFDENKSINENTLNALQSIVELNNVNDLYITPGNGYRAFISTSKVITTSSDEDTSVYDNFAEIYNYSSIGGRAIKNVTPGNLDVTDEYRIEALELDEAKAETVTRVPPFGKNLSNYSLIVGIIVLAIEIVILSILKFKIRNIRSKYIRK